MRWLCEREGACTVHPGEVEAACAAVDLLLMSSVMGENRAREGNRFRLHWRGPMQRGIRLFIPPISMRLCFDLSAANDSKITLPLEREQRGERECQPCMICSFILPGSP